MSAFTRARPPFGHVEKLSIQGRAPRSFVLFRALQVGDMLCATPAFRALRAAFPDASITLIGLPWAKNLVRRLDRYLNDFIEFPGYPGLPEQTPDPAAWAAFIANVRARQFEVAIQLHGSGSIVNSLLSQFNACLNAGFYADENDRLDATRFIPYPKHLPEVRRHLELMNFLGVPSAGETLEYPLLPEDHAERLRLARQFGLQPGRYICVHVGSRSKARRWNVEGFAAVADEIGRTGLPIVLTGSAEELALTRAVATRMRYPTVNLAGPMPLGTLAAVIVHARLLVCNDTGVSHLASALRVPSVVLFTGSDPMRWAPLNALRHRAVFADVDCRPCSFAECPYGHPCSTKISPTTVLEHVKSVLQQELVYAI